MFDPLGRALVFRRLQSAAFAAAISAALPWGAGLLTIPPASCRGVGAADARPADPPAALGEPSAESDAGKRRDSEIVAAVRNLGSDDYETREKAARFLFSQGDAAVPALRRAAEGDDPEAVRRAKTLLDDLASGLRPDSPKAVADLLGQYRSGKDAEKREAAEALSRTGAAGVRVLTELARAEPDEGLRRVLASDLGAVSRPTAAGLIAAGHDQDLELAGRLLETAGATNEAAARDWAAFLVLRGKAAEAKRTLSDALAAAEKSDLAAGPAAPPPAPPAAPAPAPLPAPVPAGSGTAGPLAMRLAYLCRAAGDPAGAVRAAEKAGGYGAPVGAGVPGGDGSQATSLAEAMLIEAGDWKAAAAKLEQRGNPEGSIESLGFLTAYYRLAGDGAAADKWAGKIIEFAAQNPGDTADAANALLLNDRADAAIDLLKRHKDYAAAMEFLGPRLRFAEVLSLLDEAKSNGAPGLAGLKTRAADAMHFQGRNKEARETLESAADGEDGALDFNDWVTLVGAARETGQPAERVDAWCVKAIEAYKPREVAGEPVGDARPRLLEKAGFQRPEQALKWWPILRARHGGEEPEATFRQLRKLDENQWPGADLDLFAGELQVGAAKLPDARRDERLVLIGETLVAAGRTDAAARVYEDLERVATDPAALESAAEYEAGRKRWAVAAALYARACAADPGRPAAQYLWGWAQEQAGQTRVAAGADGDGERLRAEGRERMARADLMALGDEAARHALADAMAKHGAPEAARRERELLARTAEFGSWELADALRQAGDAAAADDPLAAARLWDRSFLNNLSTRLSFTESIANLLIPALVHHTRAKGLLREGKLTEGMREADLSFALCPGDADARIELVNDLRDHGRRPESDTIYRVTLDSYKKLLGEYPASAPANNLVAWFEGRCHRDLDQALACAKRASDREPANTSILDTLAEVHFQRGEYDAAIELIKKCIEMEPAVKHHRENLDRFTAGKNNAATQPSAPG